MQEPLPPRPIRPAAGREGEQIQDHIPPNIMRREMSDVLIEFLERYGPVRGAMQAGQSGHNQTIPGVSVPVWLATILNMLASDPRLPYGHDRQTLHRDLLWIGAYAYAEILSRQRGGEVGTPEEDWPNHVTHLQESLRRSAYDIEQRLYFIDTLAPFMESLSAALEAHASSQVYELMQTVMQQVARAEPTFWRPMLQRMVFAFPEARQALRYLWETNWSHTADFEAWVHISAQLTNEED